MDINDMRASVTVISFLLFLGVMVWSWSKRRTAEFEEAAQLPFLDEPAERPEGEKR